MNLAVVIPAFNEASSIGLLLDELLAVFPDATPIVVSDGSVDETVAVAEAHGAVVLDLPCNLGVGGAVQAGLRYACWLGHNLVVRIDGDGQHQPAEISMLLTKMRESGVDLVSGSRFLSAGAFQSGTVARQVGNVLLAWFLSVICRRRITDPTSGFWCVQGPLLRYFAEYYPCEYPEPEAIALLHRQGYSMAEVSVTVRPREFGVSSINSLGTVYFAMRVGLALLADRVRPVDRRFAKVASGREGGGHAGSRTD